MTTYSNWMNLTDPSANNGSLGSGNISSNPSTPYGSLIAPSSNANNGLGGSDYLRAAQLIYGIVKDNKAPKFTTTPQTPEEKKLWDLYFKNLENPATRNNNTIVSGLATDALNGLHPTWNSPKTSKGETGYAGSGDRKYPAIPAFDWRGYIASGANPNPTSAPATGGIPGGTTNTHPADNQGAPPSGDPGGVIDQSFYDFLTTNPGAGAPGGGSMPAPGTTGIGTGTGLNWGALTDRVGSWAHDPSTAMKIAKGGLGIFLQMLGPVGQLGSMVVNALWNHYQQSASSPATAPPQAVSDTDPR